MRVAGSVVGVLVSVGLGAAMVPLRAHLDIATTALVLVVPVVAGVVTGGFVAGLVSVVAGFLVYDFAFIPPYYTLTVGAARNWAPLGVYVVVMAVLSRVVATLDETRQASNARAADARRLFELSETLMVERPLAELGQTIVDAVRQRLALAGATLLVSTPGGLEPLAVSGQPVPEAELADLRAGTRAPVHLSTGAPGASAHILALAAAGRPVGLLVLVGSVSDATRRELLPTIANHLALALERAQLREQARRAEILEETDRLRQALVGAVSHDLRTPLSAIKLAASTLLDLTDAVPERDKHELYELIDVQADRLSRLIASLLDMTRLEAGVLQVERAPWAVLDLVGEATAAVRPLLQHHRVDVELPEDLPLVDVDHLLVGQVLTNLLENAQRHAPEGTSIRITAAAPGPEVCVAVEDEGPGVAPAERRSVFESFVRFDTGGRAGLGLALCKAFIEAHGGRIWVEAAAGGGARFVFTVPRALAETGSRAS